MKKTLLVRVISLLFILIFLYSATSKIIDNRILELQLSKSPLIAAYSSIMRWLLPVVELVTAMLLLFNTTRITGLIISLFLMIVISSYLGFMLLTKDKILFSYCVFEGLSDNGHFLFFGVFIVLAFVGLFIQLERVVKLPGQS